MFRTSQINLNLGFSSGCLQRKLTQEDSACWETSGINHWEKSTLHGSPLEPVSDGSGVPSWIWVVFAPLQPIVGDLIYLKVLDMTCAKQLERNFPSCNVWKQSQYDCSSSWTKSSTAYWQHEIHILNGEISSFLCYLLHYWFFFQPGQQLSLSR